MLRWPKPVFGSSARFAARARRPSASTTLDAAHHAPRPLTGAPAARSGDHVGGWRWRRASCRPSPGCTLGRQTPGAGLARYSVIPGARFGRQPPSSIAATAGGRMGDGIGEGQVRDQRVHPPCGCEFIQC